MVVTLLQEQKKTGVLDHFASINVYFRDWDFLLEQVGSKLTLLKNYHCFISYNVSKHIYQF